MSESNKPSVNIRNGLIDQSADACTRHLVQHTAAIVNSVRVFGVIRNTGQRGDSEVSGSGCPMKWGQYHFILSAAHVFENAKPADIRVVVYPGLPALYKSGEDLTMADITDGQSLTEDCVIHQCAWEDLAVVSVNPMKFPGIDFIDPRICSVDPSQGENVHCCGFPSDHSIMVNRRSVSPSRDEVDLAIWPTIFGGPVLPFPSANDVKFDYDDLDPQLHYIIPYDGAGVSKHPGGISGAAVWWEYNEKKLIWRPDFRFAGTATHCHKKGTIVRVVKASVVVRFLAGLFGASGEV